ncbi:MAG: 4Fe-4S dicluster domain-containing protein [Desulfohalobiaceae bacterium]
MSINFSRSAPARDENEGSFGEGIRLRGNKLSFARELREVSRTEFSYCLQCRSCSGGCPFVEAMDLGPSKVLRLLQLGLEQWALENSTIWICVGCHTCDGNCPMAIDIPAVMDFLRQKALQRNVPVSEPDILNFHREVLGSIARYGRTHKLEIMLRYKVRTGTWFEDLDAGLRMLAKRKLDLLPSTVRSREIVQRIVQTPGQAS